MGFGDIHGSAKVDPRRPRGQGVCDAGGEWRNLNELKKQMEWQGTALVWTGMLICRHHLTKPQPQLKAIRIPADPIPLKNPRPEAFTLIDYPQGFTQYVMWADGQPLNYAVELMDGQGRPIVNEQGLPIIIEVGSDGTALLAQLSAMTGIPVPGTIQSYNSTVALKNVSQQMIPAGPKSYIAIFNPCGAPMFVNVGLSAAMGGQSIAIGPGNCLFWATAQGKGTPTASAINVLSPISEIPYYAYAA